MICLKIYGQTPSKKSGQVMVTTKVGKKFIEDWRKKLLMLIIKLEEKKFLDQPTPDKSLKILELNIDNYLEELIKDLRSSTRNILLPNKKYLK